MEQEELSNLIDEIESNDINLGGLQTWSQMHKIIEIASKHSNFKHIDIAFNTGLMRGKIRVRSLEEFEKYFPKPENEINWLFVKDIKVKE